MTKIDIFSGFLGAGKTTLIKKLIKEAYAGEKVVLIENEFGDIGVDSGFLKDAGIEITEMSAGCICCTLVGDFERALTKVITEINPERILIEPSGVGKLSDVIKAVSQVCNDDVVLNSYTTVVDAKKCKMHAKNFGEFFVNQIEYAKTVVLSHTNGMSQAKLDEVVALVREHNSACTVITTDWDKITGEQIKDTMEHKNTLAAEIEKLARERAEADAKAHDHEHSHEKSEYEEIMLTPHSHIFVIKEIDCPHCAATLAKAVKKIEGIRNVHINHEKERLVFDCHSEDFDRIVEGIKAAIEKALPEAVLCEEIPLENTHKFVIKEIDCPHCAATLAKAVNKIEGISNVEIAHDAERLTFECAPADFDRIVEGIKAAIEKALPEAVLCEEIKPACKCGHHHGEDGECHHEHHHDDEHECGCGHEHHHHHDDEHECGCGHDHHHHDDEHECECGHDHEHEHSHDRSHEGHHHADEIFASWGEETTAKFTEDDIRSALTELENSEKYGTILRAKGIVESADGGEWIHFDYIPGEIDIRRGNADVIGKLCVIGAGIDESVIKSLFIK